MRPELRQYNYDWMLWRTYGIASRVKSGTDKEYQTLLKHIPYYRNVIEEVLAVGEIGITTLKMVDDYLGNIVLAKERGHKTAISTFCFSPALLYAMDVVPITLELLTVMGTILWRRGTAEFLDYCCEVGFTETSCSSQRGSLGAYLAGLGTKIDFAVIDSPGVCDTNANSFAFAAGFLDIPIFQLNMPPTLTNGATEKYHRADYRALIDFIAHQTGHPLDEGKLASVLLEIEKQDEIINELEDLQRSVPNPLPPIFNLLIYVARFLFAGKEQGTGLLEGMLKKARENHENGLSGLASGEERIRALFCYIDHYTTDLRLWRMLESHGITHLGNILSRSWESGATLAQHQGDPEESYRIETSDLDAMIDSLASLNARMPMVKSIRGPYDARHMWLEDNLALAKIYNADIVVYNGTPGCRNTWGMVKLFSSDMERNGYPTHVMNSDAFDDRVESWEITQSRFEEFIKVRRIGE